MPDIRMGSWGITPANKVYAQELIRTGDYKKALKKAYPNTSLKNAAARKYVIHKNAGFREYFQELMLRNGLTDEVVQGLKEQLGTDKPHNAAEGETITVADNEARHKAQKLVLDVFGVTQTKTIVQQSDTGKVIDIDPGDWEDEPIEVLQHIKQHGSYPHHTQRKKLERESEELDNPV